MPLSESPDPAMRENFASFRRRLTRYFLAGLFAILPLVITVAIITWLADFLNRFVGPGTDIGRYVKGLGYRFALDGNLAYILGCLVVILALLAFGILLENGARRWLQRMLGNTVERVPVLGTLYQAATRALSMFQSDDDNRLRGMSVVLARFGDEGATWVLALAPSGDTVEIDGRPHRAVLMPTAPVPFGGALLFLPADAVRPAPMNLDEFVSVYVSMGVTMPGSLSPTPTDRPPAGDAGRPTAP